MPDKKRTNKREFEPTGISGLFKRKAAQQVNGKDVYIYWGRLAIGGKPAWKSFKTTSKTDALLMLANWRKELEVNATKPVPVTSARTVGDFADLLEADYRDDYNIGDNYRRYVKERLACLKNTWEGIRKKEVASLTGAQVKTWARELRIKRSGSTTRGTLLVLRLVLDKAVELKMINSNPAAEVELPAANRKLGIAKSYEVSPKQFDELLASMRTGHGLSAHAADLAELLALIGVRLNEAVALRWQHVNWEKKEITTAGQKWRRATQTEATVRTLPFYPRLEAFLRRQWGDGRPLENRVVRVQQCRQTLKTHCERLKLPKLHHHDLRHLFTTWAVENGIPVPTVAAWLGHKDGGALLMKTYSHVRSEHLKQAFQKMG